MEQERRLKLYSEKEKELGEKGMIEMLEKFRANEFKKIEKHKKLQAEKNERMLEIKLDKKWRTNEDLVKEMKVLRSFNAYYKQRTLEEPIVLKNLPLLSLYMLYLDKEVDKVAERLKSKMIIPTKASKYLGIDNLTIRRWVTVGWLSGELINGKYFFEHDYIKNFSKNIGRIFIDEKIHFRRFNKNSTEKDFLNSLKHKNYKPLEYFDILYKKANE